MIAPSPRRVRIGPARPACCPIHTSIKAVVWCRSDREVYQDLAGTIPATNGNPVALWKDLSGNGNHASQAVAGQRPTYVTNVINTIPGLELTVAGGLSGSAIASLNNQPITIGAVVGPFAASPVNQCPVAALWTDAPEGANGCPVLLLGTATPTLWSIFGRADPAPDPSATIAHNNTATPLIGTLTNAGAITIYGGLSRLSTTTGSNQTRTTSSGWSALGRPTIPGQHQTRVLEIAIWPTVLPIVDIRRVMTWWKARYGL